jgi:hypothetical protein
MAFIAQLQAQPLSAAVTDDTIWTAADIPLPLDVFMLRPRGPSQVVSSLQAAKHPTSACMALPALVPRAAL